MSKAKHTPGPWKAIFFGKSSYIADVTGPLEVSVATCGDSGTFGKNGSYSISKDEATANAHLCASAPDLYAALHNLLQFVPYTGIDPDTVEGETYILAKQALKKARGEKTKKED